MHSLSAPDDAAVVKFRGATYDAAVEAAQQALGPRVKVVAADRIRRGGIGGFFATELGVEVSVALHDETVDQALERLVAATAEDESSRWFEQLTSMAHSTVPASPVSDPSMTQLLTARAVVGNDTIVSHVAIDTPPAPIQPVVDQVPAVAEPVETPSVPVPAVTAVPAATTPQTVLNLVPNTVPDAVPNIVPKAEPARRRVLLPSRGHVDLAVSAAAELARLTGEQLPGRRIAVHVVVTSDDGRSVEADAIIEDRP